jgi:hypothetical protein
VTPSTAITEIITKSSCKESRYKTHYRIHLRATWILIMKQQTNVMHCLFNLLRIKGLYVFRALLAHPQESTVLRSNIPSVVCASPPEDEQVMLETCRGP